MFIVKAVKAVLSLPAAVRPRMENTNKMQINPRSCDDGMQVQALGKLNCEGWFSVERKKQAKSTGEKLTGDLVSNPPGDTVQELWIRYDSCREMLHKFNCCPELPII